jgi:hypothetical protein
MKLFGESKVDVAKMAIQDMTNTAYPMWTRSHQDKQCPERLEDLSEYMNKKDVKDPWGNPYKMFCGANLPPGAKGGFAVSSSGEDGKDGTPDDLKSWDM